MIGRVKGEAGAIDTPFGALPRPEDLDLAGVELTDEARGKLFGFERDAWSGEFEGIGEYLAGYGARTPDALLRERARIGTELGAGAMCAGSRTSRHPGMPDLAGGRLDLSSGGPTVTPARTHHLYATRARKL